MAERQIKTGSQPYDDGSGFRFEIDIRAHEDGPYMWLGNDQELHVLLTEWESLKADVDAAIAAFKSLT